MKQKNKAKGGCKKRIERIKRLMVPGTPAAQSQLKTERWKRAHGKAWPNKPAKRTSRAQLWKPIPMKTKPASPPTTPTSSQSSISPPWRLAENLVLPTTTTTPALQAHVVHFLRQDEQRIRRCHCLHINQRYWLALRAEQDLVQV